MIVYTAKPSSLERTTTINLVYKMNELSSEKHIRELKIDSTLWATPTKIINLLDFKPEKLSIGTKLNSNNNIPNPSSNDLIEIHQVRYENGGFCLTIDNIIYNFAFISKKDTYNLIKNATIIDKKGTL